MPADLRLAAATDRTLELAWGEPGNDGGSPVTVSFAVAGGLSCFSRVVSLIESVAAAQ